MPRKRGDLLEKSGLTGTSRPMSDAAALLIQRLKVNAAVRLRVREIERRGRDAESRGLKTKPAGNQAIRHLIVASASDPMDKLIGHEEAKERGQGQCPRREAKAMICQELAKARRGIPSIGRRIEEEFVGASRGTKRERQRSLDDRRPKTLAGFKVIDPEWD